MTKIPELLAPAGNMDKLMTAVRFGADAVYAAADRYGLRAFADNFTTEALGEAARLLHALGKKLYVTVNIYADERDIAGLPAFAEELAVTGADGVLVSDLGVFSIMRRYAPGLPLHVSTQANVTNSEAAKMWADLGASRIVLARETRLADIPAIKAASGAEIEAFVHGAMCISYSGRCLLSDYMTGRHGNAGECAQSCRWKYELYQGDTRISDEQELFSMSSKDLQAAAYIPALIDAGVSSLKIEGRMKSTYYIATVVHAYRALIDEYMEKGVLDASRIAFYEQEIAKAENRPTSCGFYRGLPQAGGHLYGVNGAGVTQEYIADVIAYDEVTQTALLQVKNHFRPHIEAEVFGPHTPSTRFEIGDVCDLEGRPLEVLNQPMQMVRMKCSLPLEERAMIRKVYDRSGRHVY